MHTSAHKAAQGLAALGRDEDTMLVHMTPHEVAGLQSLAMEHGGSLTINPHTGLPEAFSLKKIFKAVLPTLVGLGLSFTGLGPLAAAGLSGGITGLATKNWKQGLLAALSAGAAAGAGRGLAGLGQSATQAGGKLTEEAAKNLTGQTLRGVGQQVAQTGAKPYLSNMVAGAKQLIGGGAGTTAGMTALGGRMGLGALASYPLYEASKPPQYKMPKSATGKKFRYYKTQYHPGVYNPEAGFGELPLIGQGYDEGAFYDEYPGYADGGEVSSSAAITDYINKLNQSFKPQVRAVMPTMAPATTPAATPVATPAATPVATPAATNLASTGVNLGALGNLNLGALSEILARSGYKYDPATKQYTQTAKGYAAGGRLLTGQGDGMSDSIPAVIEGNKPQPARLADGEFVVSSDVVSHLGNGSTKAGAEKLYAMMDKVRAARTGTTKQAPAINPNKYLA